MAESAPSTQSNCLVPEDLRAFMLDNMVENNLLDLDLVWSEQEILNAMRRCAMMYNGSEPLSSSLNIKTLALPNAYVFLVGTAYQLYLSKLMNYQRNDMEYTTGGVKASIFGNRIKHFTGMIQYLREEFKELANSRKTSQNLSNAWGVIG
jgi:hypothetical protein